jgi:hypothetical protein
MSAGASVRGRNPAVTHEAVDALHRAERSLRFERGGIVYSGDGRVGTLRQVVIDEQLGEVTALVVELTGKQDCVLVPPAAVQKTAGSAVFLSGTRRQFDEWLEQAQRYDSRRGVKANISSLLKGETRQDRSTQGSILKAGRDFLEIGNGKRT